MNIFKTALVGAAALAAVSGHAFANEPAKGYEIANTHSSARIVGVWWALSGTKDPWQPVQMNAPIAPLTVSHVTVTVPGACYTDLKIRFDDGYEQVFANVNFCRGDRVVAS